MEKILSLILCLLLCSGCASEQGKEPTGEVIDKTEVQQDISPAVPVLNEESTEELSPTAETMLSESANLPEEAESKPFDGHIICIDPGHCVTPEIGKGGRERVSPLSDETKLMFGGGTAGKNLTEEKLNLLVGMKLKDRLETLGAKVVMTREISEITLSNIERCQIANQSGADICVRIHADGVDDSSVKGVSVLIPSGNLLGTPGIVEESARLGALMVNAVASETGAKNRGTVKRSDLTGFNYSEIPTVLIEMGFMTNPEEDALLETDEYQDKIVNGMVNSLAEWYGINL